MSKSARQVHRTQKTLRKKPSVLERAAGVLLVLIFLSQNVLQYYWYFQQAVPKPPKQEGNYQVVPKNEHQILAQPKVDTILKENKHATCDMTNDKCQKTEVFRWSVILPDKTVFAFGQQTERGILPVVKVMNKDGYFVRYTPDYSSFKSQASSSNAEVSNDQCQMSNAICQMDHFVSPRVNKNVISWDLADGVTARYTMSEDRVKADYVIRDQSALTQAPLRFIVTYNNGVINKDSSAEEVAQAIKNGKGDMYFIPEQTGDIVWNSPENTTLFTFPKPISTDKTQYVIATRYSIQKQAPGEALLQLSLPPQNLKKANFPITVDPSVVSSTTTATGTAYGNGRKILRDGWGNLIALIDGGTGANNVFYLAYNGTTWTNANIDLDGGAGSSVEIAADLDATGAVHLLYRDTNAVAIRYAKLNVTRNSSNAITGIAQGTGSPFSLDTSASAASVRPSLIIANKGGGANVEKVAAMWGTFGTNRRELRFMMCSVSDGCTSAANWYNANKTINGSGTCNDTATSGGVGLPNAVTCKGTADKLLADTSASTTIHGVITQVPGKPKRSPTKVFSFINASSTYTDLSNTYDNNRGTSNTYTFSSTSDGIYIGDDNKFSKVIFSFTGTTPATSTSDTVSYWNGSSWTTVSKGNDYTTDATGHAMARNGSVNIYEQPDWQKTTVNGVSKYWLFFSNITVTNNQINEIYIMDSMTHDLEVFGGAEATIPNIGVAYISWDELNNDRWETTASGSVGWITPGAVFTSSGKWSVFTSYPLSITTDSLTNNVYLAYMAGTAVGSSDITVVKMRNTAPPTSGVPVNMNFPTETEAAGTTFSLTNDGADIYLFYVLNPGTNGLVYRKWSANSNTWSATQKVLVTWNGVNGVQPNHPQAVVSKAASDIVAIDLLYTNTTGPQIRYDKLFVPSFDSSTEVNAGLDTATSTTGSGSDSQTAASSIFVGGDGVSTAKHAGFRFNSLSIAQGAKISSAYVDIDVFMPEATSGNTVAGNFTIYGEDVGNSSTFASVAAPCDSTCIQNRTRTSSSTTVATTFAATRYRIDVTNIIQEIVCRGASASQPCVGTFDKHTAGTAWSSGNSISLLFIGTASSGSVQLFTYSATISDGNPGLEINCAGGSCGTGNKGIAYSMGASTQIASGSATATSLKVANLEHPMSSAEYSAVSANDGWVASVSANMISSASSSAMPVFLFKTNNSNNSNTDSISTQVVTKSSTSSAQIPITLQVYRGGSTNDWVTVNAGTTSAPDTSITLNGTVNSNQSEYYFNETPGIGTQYAACTNSTANCWTYWRVFQGGTGISPGYTLSVDYVSTTFSAAGGGTVSRLVISLPGQTFTAGVGNSGSVTNQTAGVQFVISKITATDASYNVDTTYSGTKTLVFTGPANGPNGTAPVYTTSVSFTSGQATNVAVTLYKAETTTITVTDAGNYGFASSSLTVNSGNISAAVGASKIGLGSLSNIGLSVPVKIVLSDAWGNAESSIPAADITIGGTATAVVTQPTSATDSNGVTTGSIVWSDTGTKTVTVAISGVTLVQADGSTTDADGKLDFQPTITIGGGKALIGPGVQINSGFKIN